MAQKTLKIINEKGLHARASAKLVEVVEGFDATAEISRDGMSASGDSIMGLLMPSRCQKRLRHWWLTNSAKVSKVAQSFPF